MLKLNASYSKKIPAEGDYSSQSYHAAVEVELPDGLLPDQLQSRIHDTFALVRNSVEAELHSNNAITTNPPSGNNRERKSGHGQDSLASPKQIKFLLDLARNNSVTPEQIKSRFGVVALEALSRTQCSRAIDELSGKAVA